MTAWTPGTPVSVPFSSMTTLDPAQIPVKDIYKILIGSVIPRPIAFVSTISADGIGNLAPFSFFNGVSSNPPCLMISVSRKPDGGKKDTLLNIEQTGEFVVNSAHEWLQDPLDHCASTYPYGVNEMEIVGLTPLPSVVIRPPRVKEAAIQFECRVYTTLEIGDGSAGSSTLIVGRIVQVHLADSIYRDGKIDPHELRPLSRIGGTGYSTLGPISERVIPAPIIK